MKTHEVLPLIDVCWMLGCLRDEKTISQAVELNEQLQRALSRHDSLVSGRSLPPLAQIDQEDAEEEDPEQLFRRYA